MTNFTEVTRFFLTPGVREMSQKIFQFCSIEGCHHIHCLTVPYACYVSDVVLVKMHKMNAKSIQACNMIKL